MQRKLPLIQYRYVSILGYNKILDNLEDVCEMKRGLVYILNLCTVLVDICVLKIQILNSDFYIFDHCYYKKLIICTAFEHRLVFTQNYVHTCIL
jgi:hypothetical protein